MEDKYKNYIKVDFGFLDKDCSKILESLKSQVSKEQLEKITKSDVYIKYNNNEKTMCIHFPNMDDMLREYVTGCISMFVASGYTVYMKEEKEE